MTSASSAPSQQKAAAPRAKGSTAIESSTEVDACRSSRSAHCTSKVAG